MDTITLTNESPLGQRSEYPDEYSPDLLFAIPRSENRAVLGLGEDLPFRGLDIWNAWELTWLAMNGQPRVATAEIQVPATSPNIVESKSLKLYLNSFSMSRYDSADAVEGVIAADLTQCAGAGVHISLSSPETSDGQAVDKLPGICIDDIEVDCDNWDVDANLLAVDTSELVSESLHSHLLRSLCPVTSQADTGSVLVTYEGPKIAPASLLRYIVSFRQHKDFHEACVERMFLDIKDRCAAEKLSVYARYQRRGGIDINPFRSDFETETPNFRLWRQ